MSGVQVACGVNEISSEAYVGRSIEDVRRELRVPLNIADQAQVRLNGEPVSDAATVLRAGDQLDFSKEVGSKGSL